MKIITLLLFTAPAAIICSCSGIMPGVGILAPGDLAGYRMDYSDLGGIYEYRFSADGKYTATTKLANGSKGAPRNGKFEWDRKDSDDALLTLDGSKTLTLKFTTRDHANGTFDRQATLYAFEFTKI